MQVGSSYFLSDFHLGVPTLVQSRERERRIVDFLQRIAVEAREIFLLGDIFDFWFEYKRVVPKGFTRLLGTLSMLTDRGIPVYYFRGNHDMWLLDYLHSECGVHIIRERYLRLERNGKIILLGHGDGLGPKEYGYKFLRYIFEHKLLNYLFRSLIHPDLALRLGLYFSRKSYQKQRRKYNSKQVFGPMNDETLWLFCENYLRHNEPVDFFIFGHRHCPLILDMNERTRFCNTGDWLKHYSYLVFDGKNIQLRHYKTIDE